MSNLNALIAQGGGAPVEIDNPMNALAKALQIRDAQQTGDLNGIKIQQARTAQDRQNKLYSVLGGLSPDSTVDDHIKALRANGFIDEADKVQTGELNRVKIQGDANLANAHAGQFNQKTIGDALANTATFLPAITTPTSAATYLRGLYADPVLGPMTARLKPLDQAIAEIPQDPAGLQQWKIAHGNMTPEKFIEVTSPKATEINSGSSRFFRDTNANSPTFGQNTAGAPVTLTPTPGETLADQRIRSEGVLNRENSKTNSDASKPPVAVVDPTTGQPVYVSREEALNGRMAPASAMLGIAPKEIQAREAKFPAATAAVKETVANSTQLEKDLLALKDHPGLAGITGVVYGRTPSLTADAREAQAKLDKILARGGFSELAKMRAASPTGGALGNVSDAEGRYLRNAFGALDRTQSTASFQKAIDDAVAELQGSRGRIKDAYDNTYEYRTQNQAPMASPTPAAPASGWGKAVAK